MAAHGMEGVVQHLRKIALLQEFAHLPDEQLLRAYLVDGEQVALEAIVRRHAPMVLNVCRRVLRDPHDAEDAFQAAFLVLVRKARSIGKGKLLANWLYGVAQRSAMHVRKSTAYWKAKEARAQEMIKKQPAGESAIEDLLPFLDQELARLPDKYRTPIVLCDLEGKARRDAAKQLNLPERTLSTRLARGRVMLGKRLARHGTTLGGTAVLTILGQSASAAAMPPMLVASTVKAATAIACGSAASVAASAKVLAIAQGVIKTMLLSKLKVAAMVIIVTTVLAVGGTGLGRLVLADDRQPQETTEAEKGDQQVGDARDDLSKARIDGIVVDEAGKPVAGAVVTVFGLKSAVDGKPVRSTLDGTFRVLLDAASARHVSLLASVNDGARQGLFEYHDTVLARVAQARIVLKPSRKLPVRVVDSFKKPVAGASVGLIGENLLILATAETDATGVATLIFPSDTHVSQVFGLKSHVGFDYFENYRAARGERNLEPPTEIWLVLDGARSVLVQAKDSSDEPVAGIDFVPWLIITKGKLSEVNLGGATGLKFVGATTNQGGIANFDWIPSKLERSTEILSRAGVYSVPNSPTLDVANPEKLLVAKVYKNVEISGKVLLPDGQPAGGILLQVEGRGNTNHVFHGLARTRADGAYSLRVYPNQSYLVGVTEDQWAAPSKTGIVIEEGKPRTDLDFKLSKGTLLRGKVTIGKDNKAIADQTITLVEQGKGLAPGLSGMGNSREQLVRWAQSDADGRYAIRLGPGSYELTGPSASQQELVIQTEPTIEKDFHLDRLARGRFKGVVLTKGEGNLVAAALVKDVPNGPGHKGFEMVADASGRFETTRWQDKAFLYARNPEGNQAGIVEIGADDDFGKILISPAGKIVGRIVDQAGKPIAHVRAIAQLHVSWKDEAGRDLTLETRSDDAGRFTLSGIIPAMACTVSAADANTWRTVKDVKVTPTDTLDVGDFVFIPEEKPKRASNKSAPASPKNRLRAFSCRPSRRHRQRVRPTRKEVV